ncbi:MAG: hypothetical protein LAT68_00895 [Cyclobacteriaceae bacterium]|nr:hypothetical protein [Cyclobacteriaceae bacterium]MCH8514860.1 hypothetical protein [Cyclobacteriaceae bacterium]
MRVFYYSFAFTLVLFFVDPISATAQSNDCDARKISSSYRPQSKSIRLLADFSLEFPLKDEQQHRFSTNYVLTQGKEYQLALDGNANLSMELTSKEGTVLLRLNSGSAATFTPENTMSYQININNNGRNANCGILRIFTNVRTRD